VFAQYPPTGPGRRDRVAERTVGDQTIELADDRLAFWHWLGALAA
jgi:hypothetical protein